MARALSVGEGNGAVNCVASHATSEDGKLVRGNLAACSSGPEKSRQIRHEAGTLEKKVSIYG